MAHKERARLISEYKLTLIALSQGRTRSADVSGRSRLDDKQSHEDGQLGPVVHGTDILAIEVMLESETLPRIPLMNMSDPTSENKTGADDHKKSRSSAVTLDSVISPWTRVIYKFVLIFLYALRPSFYDYLQSKRHPIPARDKTAGGRALYLDGIRGLAALIVFFFHRLASYVLVSANIGYGQDGANYDLIRLPIIRLFYSGGHYAVGLFFIIGGYVFSIKSIDLIYTGNSHHMLAPLSKSLLRRWIRLYVPTLACSLVVAVLVQLHFTYFVDPCDTMFDQLAIWAGNSFKLINIYTNAGQTQIEFWDKYNPVTWTIPTELRGSLVVVLLLVALSTITHSGKRTWFIAFQIIVASVFGSWSIASFFIGVLLADIRHYPGLAIDSNEASLPISGNAAVKQSMLKYKTFFWSFVLFFSLYAASLPDFDFASEAQKALATEVPSPAPGYGFFYATQPTFLFQQAPNNPQHLRFWSTISAGLSVLSIQHLPAVQNLLDTQFIQYLGARSFSFYLVHNSIVIALTHTLCRTYIPAMLGLTDIWSLSYYPFLFYMLISGGVSLLATFWVADVFQRLIEVPAAKLSVRFEAFLTRTP